MIDIHSHILPGVDDGPENIDESLEIIKLAETMGIKKMVCTPHFIKGSYNNYYKNVKPVFDELYEAVKNEGIDVKLYLGTEIYFDMDIIEQIITKEVASLNDGKYVLIEFPMVSVPNGALDVFFKLQLKGYYPIICHPERNQQIINDWLIAKKFFQHEVFLQINSGSLLGNFGTDAKKTAQTLLKERLIHFIGSDVHIKNEKVLDFTRVLRIASKYMETELAVNLVTDNPAKVLSSKELYHKEIYDDFEDKTFMGKLKNLLFQI